MADLTEGFRRAADQRNIEQRTVVPGLVGEVTREVGRERDANFTPGIGDVESGQISPADDTPDAPVLSIAGGGFFVLLPSAPGDEALGLVCDRASGPWRADREPGDADLVNGKRAKALHDVMLTPFAITAPDGAPDTWDRLVLGGPAGVAIEITADGTVTVTGQADLPATPSTIVMSPDGNITIAVGTGKSVNIGGLAATALALGQKVIDAIDGAWAAATPGVADGGAALKTSWLLFWNGVKTTILALKARGE